MSNKAEAIESFLKLKYSKCIELFACLIAENMSLNFSFPLGSKVTLLFSVIGIPESRRYSTKTESARSAFALHKPKINNDNIKVMRLTRFLLRNLLFCRFYKIML